MIKNIKVVKRAKANKIKTFNLNKMNMKIKKWIKELVLSVNKKIL
jgi:hypothetical protein